MPAMSSITDRSLVPLSDRVRWSSLARFVVLTLLVLAWWLLPEQRSTPHAHLVVVVAAYIGVVVIGVALGRLGRKAAIVGIGLCLWADGVLLAWFFHVLSGVHGPVPAVIVGHVAAVTLLTSFRSGLKAAVWHCLLTLLVLSLQQEGVLDSSRDVPALTSRPVLLYVAAVWGTALAVATFAAANERELRRRRYDAEVLRELAVGIETARDARSIEERLVRFVVDDLGADRAAVVTVSDDRGVRFTRLRAGEAPVVGQGVPGPYPLLRDRPGRAQVRAFRTLDVTVDPWLSTVLPHPRHVIVVSPPNRDHVAFALLFEMPRHRRGRAPVVHRRVTLAAEQAVSHAALALGRERLVQQLRHLANTDGLTGLVNRQAFDTAFEDVLTAAGRAGREAAVVLVDLDHFKRLNDTYGHLAGDATLRAAAARLAAAVRPGDVVARYGGEEFVVILPGLGAHEAVEATERLRRSVTSAPVTDECIRVTASFGVAVYPVHGSTAYDLLAAADSALYDAKEQGRDRVCLAEVRARADVPADLLGGPAS